MNFIYPAFLFALSALAIPIIVHLFNFRKFKKIYFTNVRFLREIKQDTQSRSRLKHLLILLSRLLAVAFLVLAFAQPYIPTGKGNVVSGLRAVSIYIDNSFSMDALGKNGSLVESAKKKAREIALAYNPSDRFQLLTNDFEARHQRLLSREEFLQQVDDVQTSGAAKKLSDVVSRQLEALNNHEDIDSKTSKTAYEISDFQKTTANPELIKSDTGFTINLVPVVPQKVNNLFVDTFQLKTPFIQLNTACELVVKIRNHASEPAENIPVKLTINGVQKALSSVTIQAQSSAETRLSFTIAESGWQQAELSITDYPVAFDDSYYFSFNVKEHLNVLALNGSSANPYLQAVFKNDDYFVFNNASVNQVDYSSFNSYQLIVMNEVNAISSGLAQEMKKYLAGGGTVFVLPSPEADLLSYRSFLEPLDCNYPVHLVTGEDKMAKMESQHSIFAGVFDNQTSIPENIDLPVVKKYFQISRNLKTKEEALLKMQSGNTFLSVNEYKKGSLFLSCVPLNDAFSNLHKHAIFVPIMLKAAFRASSEIHQPLVVGQDEQADAGNISSTGENIFHLVNSKMNFDVIPEIKMIENKTFISVHDQVKQAGNYLLIGNNTILSCISFNYNRSESDLDCFTADELQVIIEKRSDLKMNTFREGSSDLSHDIAQLNEGVRLWKYCVILALIFLAMEVLLIRFFR